MPFARIGLGRVRDAGSGKNAGPESRATITTGGRAASFGVMPMRAPLRAAAARRARLALASSLPPRSPLACRHPLPPTLHASAATSTASAIPAAKSRMDRSASSLPGMM